MQYILPQFGTNPTQRVIQPKINSQQLQVGAQNDAYEREADQVANQVMQMPMSGARVQGINKLSQKGIQRKCSACAEEEKIQRKPLSISKMGNTQGKSTHSTAASANVSEKISSTRGQGQSLDGPTRGFMEGRFGQDFSNVKVHTGGYASQLNRDLNAKAFAVGSDIYFNAGQYQPNSDSGKHLLAHELTHVVQQNGGSLMQSQSGSFIQRTPDEDDPNWQGPKLPNNACMTFDDGPHGSATEMILGALGSRHATFFITGRKVEDGGSNPVNEDPGEQYRLVKAMLEAHHQIANHSLTHRPLTDSQYAAADPADVVSSFRQNETYWQDLFLSHQDQFSGFDFTRLPGQGRGYAEIVAALTEDSSLPHVGWDYEFCPHEECSWIPESNHNWMGVEGVKGSSNTLPPANAIILLHDHHWEGKSAQMNALITRMTELNFSFGRLSKNGSCQ